MNRLRYLSSATAATIVVALLGVAAAFAITKGAAPTRSSTAHVAREKLTPAITASNPTDQGFYGAAKWAGGCSRGAGVCGTALIPRGFNAVLASIESNTSRRYWNGRGYKSRRVVYNRAALSPKPRRTKQPKPARWFYSLRLPRPDGRYTLRILAVNQTHKARQVRLKRTLTFTIDTVAPAPPVITAAPANSTSASSATFSFLSREGQLSYSCSLDNQAWRPCASPAAYPGLGVGHHSFRVQAIDRAGNVSAPAISAWAVAATRAVVPPAGVTAPASAGVPFTISGSAAGLLYPGGAARTIPLTLSNPNTVAIHVTSVAISLQASNLPAGCAASNYGLSQASVPGAGIEIPAHASVTLPAQGATAPLIQIVETHSNQDPCEGTRLALDYSGSAHS
jgi:hypothetical protein